VSWLERKQKSSANQAPLRTRSSLWPHSSATTGWDRPWSRMRLIAGDQAKRKPARANPTLSDQFPLRVCLCALCILAVCESRLTPHRLPRTVESRIGPKGEVNPKPQRNRSHTQTHDTNNTTNDHTNSHPPHFTTIEGGAATVVPYAGDLRSEKKIPESRFCLARFMNPRT